jgi:lipopolysaccharide biosynthesis glycosyltransferase
MRTLVVTASNDAYMPLLTGLLTSLEQLAHFQFFEDIACLDVGLSAGNLHGLAARGIRVVQPGWDLPVAAAVRTQSPHLRAMTARPFLPQHFPGYDLYIWIDCDAWVQEKFACDWLLGAGKDGALAIVPEFDQAYDNFTDEWRKDRLQQYFGETVRDKLRPQTYFNSGVFALTSDAPHWMQWARHFELGLQAAHGTLVCDQTALNGAIWFESLPVSPLPARCNWLCHLALPCFDRTSARFCETLPPHEPIGIVHLSGGTKDLAFRLQDIGQAQIDVSLRCPAVN